MFYRNHIIEWKGGYLHSASPFSRSIKEGVCEIQWINLLQIPRLATIHDFSITKLKLSSSSILIQPLQLKSKIPFGQTNPKQLSGALIGTRECVPYKFQRQGHSRAAGRRTHAAQLGRMATTAGSQRPSLGWTRRSRMSPVMIPSCRMERWGGGL